MTLSSAQALESLTGDDLIGLGMEAGGLRRRLHPERVATYTVQIALPLASTPEQLDVLLHRADRLGATGFNLQAGGTTVAALEDLLHRLKREYPAATLHGLTATDLTRLSATEALPLADLLTRLQQAGLAALSGEDAFLLTDPAHPDAARRPADLCSSADWLHVHRTAHALGLPSTASLTFGLGEDLTTRITHLGALRTLQAEAAGFIAFTLRAWTPAHPDSNHRTLDEATAVDYLKTLAVARLVLDTIPHFEADPAQGLKITQMALRFGADDAGPVLTDPRAISLAGPSNCATEEELRRLIRDAGYMPVQRDHLYRTCFLV